MKIAMTGLGACLPLAGLLAGCSMGEPASAEHVEDLMRADSVEDGYEVSWVHAEPMEEEGSFRTFVDRAKPAEAGSDETWMCNVQATTVSNSWSCQTVSPAIITQAVGLLEQQYTGRGLEVAEYEIARSSEGTAFTGNMVLRDPVSGERAWVPCAGTQDGTRFEIECDQDGARMLPPEGSPGGPPEDPPEDPPAKG